MFMIRNEDLQPFSSILSLAVEDKLDMAVSALTSCKISLHRKHQSEFLTL
jgi:hypothetical protein